LSNIAEAINDLIASLIANAIIKWALTALGIDTSIMSAPKKAVKSYQEGTNSVPATGLAYLHKGEMIIPANLVEAMRGFNLGNIGDWLGDVGKDIYDFINGYIQTWLKHKGQKDPRSDQEKAWDILHEEKVDSQLGDAMSSGIRNSTASLMQSAIKGMAIMPGLMQKMGAGGIINGTKNGTQIIAGENYQSEAIVPLNKLSGITININAGTIIADNMSVREFARKIDNELYRLNRNKQTNSIL
jgi:hypothetical protein